MSKVDDGPPAADERHRLIEEIVVQLGELEFLYDPAHRLPLFQEMRKYLSGPGLDTAAAVSGPDGLTAMTRGCAAQPGGLHELADQVRRREPGARQVHVAMARLVDEWSVTRLLSDTDMRWLHNRLATLPMTSALLRIVPAASATPPAYCRTAWHFFAHLASLGSDGGTPAWLRLLDGLARPGSGAPDPDRTMRGIVDALNPVWELPESVGTAAAPGPEDPGAAYLIVQFEKYGGDDRRFLMTPWHQRASPPGWESVRGDARLVDRGGLEAALDEVVLDAERRWSDLVGPMRIELVLPWQLINEPVERWRKELSSASPGQLTAHYSVTVRSLERHRSTHWHRAWHRRWRRVGIGGSVHCLRAEDRAVALDAALSQDETIVVAILSEPPTPDSIGERQLALALRNGIPAIIWHRRDPISSDVCENVRATIDAPSAELPERVMRIRRQAWAAPAGPSQLWHELALMWDDHGRRHEEFAYE